MRHSISPARRDRETERAWCRRGGSWADGGFMRETGRRRTTCVPPASKRGPSAGGGTAVRASLDPEDLNIRETTVLVPSLVEDSRNQFQATGAVPAARAHSRTSQSQQAREQQRRGVPLLGGLPAAAGGSGKARGRRLRRAGRSHGRGTRRRCHREPPAAAAGKGDGPSAPPGAGLPFLSGLKDLGEGRQDLDRLRERGRVEGDTGARRMDVFSQGSGGCRCYLAFDTLGTCTETKTRQGPPTVCC